MQGIITGPTALVMGEVELILRDSGITADSMADAGLSREESERLLHGLYVHSTGFLQMLADTFSGLPHRHELLKQAWTGFTTLLERAQGGDELLGYASVLAAQRRDSEAAYASLEAEYRQTSHHLQEELGAARVHAEEETRRWKSEQSRAEKAEAVIESVTAERDELQALVVSTEGQLTKAVELRKGVEQSLAQERSKLKPLQEKAVELSAAMAEAAKLRSLAGRATLERDSVLEASRHVDKQLKVAEVMVRVLRSDLMLMDGEHTRALEALDEARADGVALQEELKGERARVTALHEAEIAKEALHQEEVLQMATQMEESGQDTTREQEAREEVEKRSAELQEELTAAAEAQEQQGKQIASNLKKIAELTAVIAQKDFEINEAKIEADRQKRLADAAAAAKEVAVKEVSNVQKESRRIIVEKDRFRDDAKIARNELTQLQLQANRNGEELRSDLEGASGARDAATAELEQVKESYTALQERAAKLEEELQRQRVITVEREVELQQYLVEQEKHLSAERNAYVEAQAVLAARAEADAQILKATLAEVGELHGAIGAIQAEVSRLTEDNRAYELQIAAYEVELASVHELRSTCDAVGTTADVLDVGLRANVTEQLALQCEQQRCIDAAERDLSLVLERLDECSVFFEDEMQPIVEAAWAAIRDQPGLKEELLQTGLLRAETLAQLRQVRDAAEEERQRHVHEMTAHQLQAAKDKEQSTFTTELQASQLAQLNEELGVAMEELENWRKGNIRLSNAKGWRQETPKAQQQALQSRANDIGTRFASTQEERTPEAAAMRYQRPSQS